MAPGAGDLHGPWPPFPPRPALILVQLLQGRVACEEPVMIGLVDRDAVLVGALVDVQDPLLEFGSIALGADLGTADATAPRLGPLSRDFLGKGSSLAFINYSIVDVSPIELVLAALEHVGGLELLSQPFVPASLPNLKVHEAQQCNEVRQMYGYLLSDASFDVLVALLLAWL